VVAGAALSGGIFAGRGLLRRALSGTWHLPVPDRTAARLRATAARILSGRLFHPKVGLLGKVLNWLDNAVNSVLDWLSKLHIPFTGPGGGAGWVADVVVVLLALLVLAGAVTAFRRGFLGRLRAPGSLGVVVTEASSAMAPDAWRREAERLASEGRYREALRCRYRALVGELARRGLVDEVPGRTSGDYERLVGALVPEVKAQFSSLTGLFERCWYGREPTGAGGQVAFEELASAVVRQVDERRDRARGHDAGPGPAGGPAGKLVGAR
jgi:hypothetical protein